MNRKTIYIITGVLVVLVAGYYLYTYITKSQAPSVSTALNQITNQTQNANPAVTNPDWNTCNYPGFGFKMQYPKDWSVSFISNAQGAGDHSVKASCGEIDARALLPKLIFSSNTQADASATLTILEKSGGTSDAAVARLQMHSSGTTIYKGQQYSVSFGKNVSSEQRTAILNSFDFVN